jgi:L-lactate dehydrogenase complex protein LldF
LDACPVRIDIPEVLVHLRSRVVDAKRGKGVPTAEAMAMKAAAAALSSGHRLGTAARVAGMLGRLLRLRPTAEGGRRLIKRVPGPGASAWTDARDLPVPSSESFRAWWRRTGGGRS